MMIKLFGDLIKLYLKEHGSKQVKVEKSKLLIFDEYLNKYVSADELLIPGEKANTRPAVMLIKSKEALVFDLLLKKFVNPKLDLLSPQLKNFENFSQCDSVTDYRNFGSSSVNLFWVRKRLNKKKQLCHLPAVNFSAKVRGANESSNIQKGWAGQVTKYPVSDPRPEHSKPDYSFDPGKDPKKKERDKSKLYLVCTSKIDDKRADCIEHLSQNNKILPNPDKEKTVQIDSSICSKTQIPNEPNKCLSKSNTVNESKEKSLDILKEEGVHKRSVINVLKKDTTSIVKKICCKIFPSKTNEIIKNEDDNRSSIKPNQSFSQQITPCNKFIGSQINNTLSKTETDKQGSKVKQTMSPNFDSKITNSMNKNHRETNFNETQTPTQLYLCKVQNHNLKGISREIKSNSKKFSNSDLKTKEIATDEHQGKTQQTELTKEVRREGACNNQKPNLNCNGNETEKNNVSNLKGKVDNCCKSKAELDSRIDGKKRENQQSFTYANSLCERNIDQNLNEKTKSVEILKYNFITKPMHIPWSELNRNAKPGLKCKSEKNIVNQEQLPSAIGKNLFEGTEDKNEKQKKKPIEALKYNFITKPMKIPLREPNINAESGLARRREKSKVNQKQLHGGACSESKVELFSKQDSSTKSTNQSEKFTRYVKSSQTNSPTCETLIATNKQSKSNTFDKNKMLKKKIESLKINTCVQEKDRTKEEECKTLAKNLIKYQEICHPYSQIQKMDPETSEKLDCITQENSLNKVTDLSTCKSYMGFKVTKLNTESNEIQDTNTIKMECDDKQEKQSTVSQECLKKANSKTDLNKKKSKKKVTVSEETSKCAEKKQSIARNKDKTIDTYVECKKETNLELEAKETCSKIKNNTKVRKSKKDGNPMQCKDKSKSELEKNKGYKSLCLQLEEEAQLNESSKRQSVNTENLQNMCVNEVLFHTKITCNESDKEKINKSTGKMCFNSNEHDLKQNVSKEKDKCPALQGKTYGTKCKGSSAKKKHSKKTDELPRKSTTPKLNENYEPHNKGETFQNKYKNMIDLEHLSLRSERDISQKCGKTHSITSLEKPWKRILSEVQNERKNNFQCAANKTAKNNAVLNHYHTKFAYSDEKRTKKKLLKIQNTCKKNIQNTNNNKKATELQKVSDQDTPVKEQKIQTQTKKSFKSQNPSRATICSKYTTVHPKERQKTFISTKPTVKKTGTKVIKKCASTSKICNNTFNKINTNSSKQSFTKSKTRSISSLPAPQKSETDNGNLVRCSKKIGAKFYCTNRIVDFPIPVLAAKSTAFVLANIKNIDKTVSKPGVDNNVSKKSQTNDQTDFQSKVEKSAICQDQKTLFDIGKNTGIRLDTKLTDIAANLTLTWKASYDQMNKLTDKIKENIKLGVNSPQVRNKLCKIGNEIKTINSVNNKSEKNENKIDNASFGNIRNTNSCYTPVLSKACNVKLMKTENPCLFESNQIFNRKKEMPVKTRKTIVSPSKQNACEDKKAMSKTVTTLLEKISHNSSSLKYLNNQPFQSAGKNFSITRRQLDSLTGVNDTLEHKESTVGKPNMASKINVMDKKDLKNFDHGFATVKHCTSLKCEFDRKKNTNIPKVEYVKKLSIIKPPLGYQKHEIPKLSNSMDEKLKKIAKKGQILHKRRTKEYLPPKKEVNTVSSSKTNLNEQSASAVLFFNSLKRQSVKHKEKPYSIKKDPKKVVFQINQAWYSNKNLLKLKKRVYFFGNKNEKVSNETPRLIKDHIIDEQKDKPESTPQVSVNKLSYGKTQQSAEDIPTSKQTLLVSSTKVGSTVIKSRTNSAASPSPRKSSENSNSSLPKPTKNNLFINRTKTIPTRHSDTNMCLKKEKATLRPQSSNCFQPLRKRTLVNTELKMLSK